MGTPSFTATLSSTATEPVPRRERPAEAAAARGASLDDQFPGLPATARVFMLAVILAAATAIGIGYPSLLPARIPAISLLLALAGGLLGSRSIQIGPKLNLSVIQPFIFASLVLEGAGPALVVAFASTLGAGAALLRRGRMSPSQVLFNISAVLLSTLGAALVYLPLLSPDAGISLERCVLPVLAASLVYFLTNSWLIAIVIGLEQRVAIVSTWLGQALWSAPSFLAGGILGLGIARCLSSPWWMLLPIALPFCYLIHHSYRLYSDRLRERQERVEMFEKLTSELEEKVRQRTEDLHKLNEDLRTSSRHKSEFVAKISHELRTPLNAIIGFSELLGSEAGAALLPRWRNYLDDIHSSGTDLLGIINDLLDLSKIEAGKMRIDFEPCLPGDLAADALSLVRGLSAAKSLRLELLAADDLPAIEADRCRLKQVLWNLLSNAIKFTPAGGAIRLAVDPVGDGVRFAVTDTGCGVPEAELQLIFDDFYQVDVSNGRRHGGTGLGLSLVRQFTEMHHGHVEVRSVVGEGSTFEVWVPLRAGSEGQAPPAADRTAEARRA